MSTVWDRTTEVMRGRFGMLATIAALLGVLPTVAQQAYVLFRMGGGATSAAQLAAMGGGTMLIFLVVGLLALWNGLALVVAASDPTITSAGAAIAAGLRRLPVLVGLTLLLGLLMLLLSVPVGLILGAGVMGLATVGGGTAPAAGTVLAVALYILLLLALLLWLFARLLLLNPVVANERRGLGSFARSFELTRGLALRLVGVLILFVIVLLVVSFAVQAVVGIVFSLLLGTGSLAALFLTAVVSACVGAGLTIVFTTFTAALYRMVTGQEAAETFG